MEASSRKKTDQLVVAKIVSGYVRKNQLSPTDIPTLINTVYQSLLALGKPPEPEPPTPAVPIRRSVTRNYVVCLECGWQGHTLRRHIQAKHGVTADEYRARWKLPSHHALVAPAYSERRSEIAKELSLGQHLRGRPSADQPTRSARRRRRGGAAISDPSFSTKS
jgi:predicted transcriptional regulator